jgi:hypothetical protein
MVGRDREGHDFSRARRSGVGNKRLQPLSEAANRRISPKK